MSMAEREEANMSDARETKLNSIINALEALRITTETVSKRNEELYLAFHRSHGPTNPQLVQQMGPPISTPAQFQASGSHFQGTSTMEVKEPRISLPEKFDGTRSKFRGFVNQVRLITLLQPQRYPTEISRVGLVGTLLSGQALF